MNRSSIIILAADLVLAFTMLRSARRSRTSERLVLGWLAVCAVIAVLAVWRESIDRLAELLDVHYPPSALFLIGFAGVLVLTFRLSVELGEERRRVRKLAQEVALLTVRQPGPAAPPP